MYYKYRSLANLQFALDIFVNRRLYAAEFTKLNDPMEGTFTYGPGTVSGRIANALYGQKQKLLILSLCEEPDNMLMWSYYAEGHKGFVVGGDLTRRTKARSVNYVDTFELDWKRQDAAEVVLSRKHSSWKHEREHRVFLHMNAGPFVTFKPKELIFGIETDPALAKLMGRLAKKFNPSIRIRHMERSNLNVGAGSVRAMGPPRKTAKELARMSPAERIQYQQEIEQYLSQ